MGKKEERKHNSIYGIVTKATGDCKPDLQNGVDEKGATEGGEEMGSS